MAVTFPKKHSIMMKKFEIEPEKMKWAFITGGFVGAICLSPVPLFRVPITFRTGRFGFRGFLADTSPHFKTSSYRFLRSSLYYPKRGRFVFLPLGFLRICSLSKHDVVYCPNVAEIIIGFSIFKGHVWFPNANLIIK